MVVHDVQTMFCEDSCVSMIWNQEGNRWPLLICRSALVYILVFESFASCILNLDFSIWKDIVGRISCKEVLTLIPFWLKTWHSKKTILCYVGFEQQPKKFKNHRLLSCLNLVLELNLRQKMLKWGMPISLFSLHLHMVTSHTSNYLIWNWCL